MLKIHTKNILVTLMFLGLSVAAKASIGVHPITASLDKSGVGHITVDSKNKEIQFVKSSVKQIVNPGMPNEHTVEVDHWQDNGLVITPTKFALAAGAKRLVRLVALELPAKETTWRVYFESVTNEQELEADPSTEETVSTQIGVNIIWGVLVHVPPKQVTVALHADKASGQVFNSGTIRVDIKEVATCTTEKSCVWSTLKERHTIYPDGHRVINGLKPQPGHLYRVRYLNWITHKIEEIKLPLS